MDGNTTTTTTTEPTTTVTEPVQQTQQTAAPAQQTTTKPQTVDDMSKEELVSMVQELQRNNIHLKNTVDKLSTSEGSLRKQLKAKMTVDEQEAAAQQEHAEYVASLEKQVKVMKQSSDLIKNGFTEEEANQIAEARYSGDIDKARELENAHFANMQKKLEADYQAKVAKLMQPASGNTKAEDFQKQFEAAKESGDTIAMVKAIMNGAKG